MRASDTDLQAPAAVLDTNIALDWLVFGNTGVSPLLAAIAAGRLRWLASDAMRAELAHVLAHQGFGTRKPNVELALASFDGLVQLASPEDAPPLNRPRCSDASDQMFIDLALQHRCRWLVSRDRALLKLRRRLAAWGVQVCTPETWAP